MLHNDPNIDPVKAWPWEYVRALVRALGPGNVVLLGNPGPEVPGALDFRGRTTLAQAAAIIRESRCYVGIDSGPGTREAGGWIAGSLRVPAVGLYGTSYIPAYGAIQPENPRAVYLQAEGALDSLLPDAVRHAVLQISRGN